MTLSSFVLQRPAQKTDIALIPLTAKAFPAWKRKQSKAVQQQLDLAQFSGAAGKALLILNEKGLPHLAVFGVESASDLWSWAALPTTLPTMHHYFVKDDTALSPDLSQAALGWQLGCYRFDEYRSKPKKGGFASLVLPSKIDLTLAREMADSIALGRDLINTPTNDMGPSELAAAARKVARECKAKYSEIVGDDLLKQNFPTIHAVGRACDDAPRLIRLDWGDKKHPQVTLVGKGVCFDTGGLNIKPESSMALMKKDMGGAAMLLGLARLIMKTGLKLRLSLLIPAVENSISGNAFRPQDVIRTRRGITVEIGNTDAEGRLILCDALALADDEKPQLLIDAATLTGAARVATGPDVPAFFSSNDTLADELMLHARSSGEMLWQLPLWNGYRYYIDSDIADINNAASTGYAGAITAALFLKEFLNHSMQWLHIDMMAWNTRSQPGRPKGGEAQGLRALYSLLATRYSGR